MGRSKKKSRVPLDVSTPQQQKESNCYDGERLVTLLKSIHREIESAKLSKGPLPEKVWIKQQFSIGVNEVTRALERMTPCALSEKSAQDYTVQCGDCKESSVQLQAVLLASDCNPRLLAKHIPDLAASRKVPVIIVKDKKGGSLRLGELVKLKTAIAIGVKAKGSVVNTLVAEIIKSIESAGGTGSRQVG